MTPLNTVLTDLIGWLVPMLAAGVLGWAIQRKYGLRQTGRTTIRCIQRDVGADPDGILVHDTTRRIQICLNTGRF